jgi:enoyl-CoA hydratase
MSYEHIVYDIPIDGVARITLNRPEVLNAHHLPMLEEIYAAADAAEKDNDIAVLVYRGEGRAFCAGRDFKYSGQLQADDPDGWFAWRTRYKGFGDYTWQYPKATISQVHGYALGGGHNLAVACDITIAATDAKFGYPEARYGIMSGGRHVWNWLMGPKKTKEYLFTGRLFGAEEAMQFGLINQVVAREELEDVVIGMAKDIVAIERKHPGYIRVNKFLINQRHLDLLHSTAMNPDVLEAIPHETAFVSNAKRSQEDFFQTVADEGMQVALDALHSDHVSQSRDAS